MRSLALGFGVGLLAAVAALFALAAVSNDGVIAVTALVVGFGVAIGLSVASGVFGREFAQIAVAWCGAWAAWTANVVRRAIVDDTTDLLTGGIAVLVLCFVGFVTSFIGWAVGTIVCAATGHHTSRELSAIAYARTDTPGSGSGRQFVELLDEVAARHAGDQRVVARSMAVERRRVWSRPFAIVATERQLVIAPVGVDDVLHDDVVAVPTHAVAEASIRSLDRHGNVRRPVSSHDDWIDLATRDGRRLRFILAYQSRTRALATREPSAIGGADAIRHWIRTHATTYR